MSYISLDSLSVGRTGETEPRSIIFLMSKVGPGSTLGSKAYGTLQPRSSHTCMRYREIIRMQRVGMQQDHPFRMQVYHVLLARCLLISPQMPVLIRHIHTYSVSAILPCIKARVPWSHNIKVSRVYLLVKRPINFVLSHVSPLPSYRRLPRLLQDLLHRVNHLSQRVLLTVKTHRH